MEFQENDSIPDLWKVIYQNKDNPPHPRIDFEAGAQFLKEHPEQARYANYVCACIRVCCKIVFVRF